MPRNKEISPRHITPKAVENARKHGFEVGFFVNGKPEKMVIRDGQGMVYGADGTQIDITTLVRFGIFNMKGGEIERTGTFLP